MPALPSPESAGELAGVGAGGASGGGEPALPGGSSSGDGVAPVGIEDLDD